jgi:uncharacterized protein with FMN-binding domain
MKRPITLLALAALAACTQQAEQSVANQFQNTENALENAADTLEAETENATRGIENSLQNQADAAENRIDAIDVVPSRSDDKATNKQ